jgi:hypothetical protein
MAAGCVSSIAYIPSDRRSIVIELSMLVSAARARWPPEPLAKDF